MTDYCTDVSGIGDLITALYVALAIAGLLFLYLAVETVRDRRAKSLERERELPSR